MLLVLLGSTKEGAGTELRGREDGDEGWAWEHPTEAGGGARGRAATKAGEGKQEKGAGPTGAWSCGPVRRARWRGWGAGPQAAALGREEEVQTRRWTDAVLSNAGGQRKVLVT